MKCDIRAGRCIGSEFQLLLAGLTPSRSTQVTTNLITKSRRKQFQRNPWSSLSLLVPTKKTCPNKDFSCEDNQTCCKLSSDDDYGCCPLGPDAICCEDKEHCCPHGTKCDVSGGTC